MAKEIPWVQTYPSLNIDLADPVTGPLPSSITEAELDSLIDAGFEFITYFDTANPFESASTMVLRQGKKQFMTKLRAYSLEDFIKADEMNAELEKATADLLRAALDDMIAFGHDGKSA